jgi:hypothetical protein
VFRISEVEMLFPTFTTAQGGVETQGLELNDEFGGYYGVEC